MIYFARRKHMVALLDCVKLVARDGTSSMDWLGIKLDNYRLDVKLNSISTDGTGG